MVFFKQFIVESEGLNRMAYSFPSAFFSQGVFNNLYARRGFLRETLGERPIGKHIIELDYSFAFHLGSFELLVREMLLNCLLAQVHIPQHEMAFRFLYRRHLIPVRTYLREECPLLLSRHSEDLCVFRVVQALEYVSFIHLPERCSEFLKPLVVFFVLRRFQQSLFRINHTLTSLKQSGPHTPASHIPVSHTRASRTSRRSASPLPLRFEYCIVHVQVSVICHCDLQKLLLPPVD
mmetsp:Transcript_32264/g.56639  ORF Transcript_32264/g.56639 Transcript_32264/m.56639 type:complete len:235 (+) Transcript_32264:343-1047(+)